MNIAIQALVIFSLALPGIILRKTYWAGGEGLKEGRPTLAEEVVYSFVLACGLHAVWAWLAHVVDWPVDLEAVTLLLLGQYGPDSTHLPRVLGALTSHPYRILIYFASIYAVAYGLGRLSRWLVRRSDWKNLLPRPHYWHSLLNPDGVDYDLVFVSFVVDTSAGSFLYVGALEGYYFKRGTNDLDLLVINVAMRRKLGDEPAGTEERQETYYFIDAERLCMKYSEVKDIGIRLVRMETDPPADAVAEEQEAAPAPAA